MYGFIMDNLNYEPKMIVQHIEQTYQYTISYLKAWRAKQRVFEQTYQYTIRCLFLIQPIRKAKAAVRHVVFGMVWTSPKQARHKSVAANVEHRVTTTRG